MSCAALLRLLFADHGSLDDLDAALTQFDEDARQLQVDVLDLMAGYLRGEHPFPQRTHLSVLFATFQLEYFDLIERWVAFAKNEIAAWPDTKDLGMTERTEQLLRIITAGESALEHPRTSGSTDD